MSIIKSVTTLTTSVPLPAPVGFSSRTVTRREYTLVRITTEQGVSGIGFCYPGHAAAELSTIAVRDLLGPLLVGEDCADIERLWNRMYQEALLHGRTGSVMRALSAIDIALWDAKAREAGLPLHKLLGGHADRVPAYASGGYYLDGKGPDGLARELAGYVEAGFTAVKMKIGRLDHRGELDRLAAAREAVGPDTLLMLDANNAFSDLPTALRAVRAWERFDPYFVEEPFSPDDITNHARLAARVDVPIATGEIEAGRWRTRELLEQGGAIILQQDAAVCGGISELQKIAHTASSYGVTLCPHWFHDVHAPVAGAFSNVRFVEYFPHNDVFNFGDLVDRQLVVDGGELVLHDAPGLGFSFEEDAVARFAHTDWTAAELRD
ncbi:mandelate racemase/muconate lactonizing enzyme family protein [Pseudonocardia nematodicida]|uniref:Mandelate racemase/muconate lactonizing enzyme family protein n=1 Tax=Pseudonocardia nematodicida TaxID=1206997 RepID=A0ABV1KA99_9PSEU